MRGGRGEAREGGRGSGAPEGCPDGRAGTGPRRPGGGRAHALELVLDDAGEKAVRGRWAMLEEGGVPSMARHTGTTHRPHVTVLSGPPPSEDALRVAAEAVGALLPMDLPVSGLGLLGRPGRSTLVELLVPPIPLLRARARLAGLWTGADQRPWLAHLTLAQRLSPEAVGMTLSLLAGPASARVDDLAADLGPAVAGARVRRAVGLRWWDPDLDRVMRLSGS